MKSQFLIVIIITTLYSCSDNNGNSVKKDLIKKIESKSSSNETKKVGKKITETEVTKVGFVVGQWYFNDDADNCTGTKGMGGANDYRVYGRFKSIEYDKSGNPRCVKFDRTIKFCYNSMAYQGHSYNEFADYFTCPVRISKFLANPVDMAHINDMITQVKRYKQGEESRSTDGSDEFFDVNDAEIQP